MDGHGHKGGVGRWTIAADQRQMADVTVLKKRREEEEEGKKWEKKLRPEGQEFSSCKVSDFGEEAIEIIKELVKETV